MTWQFSNHKIEERVSLLEIAKWNGDRFVDLLFSGTTEDTLADHLLDAFRKIAEHSKKHCGCSTMQAARFLVRSNPGKEYNITVFLGEAGFNETARKVLWGRIEPQ